MSTLIIDSASDRTILGLFTEEPGTSALTVLKGARDHASRILPAIDVLLRSYDLTPAKLEKIVVGVGPGSYTGTRIAISVAQGLAFANTTPIAPIDSIELYAYLVSAYLDECSKLGEHPDYRSEHLQTIHIWAFIDARMGQYYLGKLELDHRTTANWKCTLNDKDQTVSYFSEAASQIQTASQASAASHSTRHSCGILFDSFKTLDSLTAHSASGSDAASAIRDANGICTLDQVLGALESHTYSVAKTTNLDADSAAFILKPHRTLHQAFHNTVIHRLSELALLPASDIEASYLRQSIGWDKRTRIRV